MIKGIIKKICYKVYSIGRFEHLRLLAEERKRLLESTAEIHPTAFISENATIINGSRPKDKIRIGRNSRIMGQLFLFDRGGEISIGEDCFVGPDTRIWSAGSVSRFLLFGLYCVRLGAVATPNVRFNKSVKIAPEECSSV